MAIVWGVPNFRIFTVVYLQIILTEYDLNLFIVFLYIAIFAKLDL